MVFTRARISQKQEAEAKISFEDQEQRTTLSSAI